MGKVIERHAIADDFYTKVSTVAQYNMGAEVTIADSETGYETTFKYIKASGGLTANRPYLLVDKGDAVGTANPATSTVPLIVGIPQVTIITNQYGWVAIKGKCTARTGVQAKDDTLEVINSGSSLIVDGTSGSPAETVNTVAISAETVTATGNATVILLGKRVQIAAS